MKLYRNLFYIGVFLASLGAYAQGFTTNNTNGNLIDANGQPFIIKGVNMTLAWYVDQVNGSIADVRKNTKSNCIRNEDGGIDEIANLAKDARYVKLTGTQRATSFGYSLYEVEVYGKSVVTSLEDEVLFNTTVYPNPFQDKINLNLSSSPDIQITDMSGTIFYNGFGHEIETSSFPRGVYLLKIRQKWKC